MAFEVTLYSFSKRTNSTKQPPAEGVAHMVFDMELKTDCSVQNPVFIFNLNERSKDGILFTQSFPNQTPAIFNYLYCREFGRYYFINEWTYSAGLWQAVCTVDVLGTYRTQIGNANLYVLRSSNRYNGQIIDEMYPTSAYATNTMNGIGSIWAYNPNSPTDGFYVIGIVGKDVTDNNGAAQHGIGPVNYYAVNTIGLQQFMRQYLTSESYLGIDTSELSSGLQRALFNPIQYVVSCMYIPLKSTYWNASSDFQKNNPHGTNMTFGWYNFTIPAGFTLCNSRPWIAFDVNINVPKHPSTSYKGNWVNLAPYSQYTLECWPFGSLPIDSSKIVNTVQLKLSIMVDLITGVGVLRVTDANLEGDGMITTSQGQVGVPIQLTQLSLDYGNLTSSSTLAKAGIALGADAINQSATKHTTLFGRIANEAKGFWKYLTDPNYRKSLTGHEGEQMAAQAEQTGIQVKETAAAIGEAANASMGVVTTNGSNGGIGALTLATRLDGYFINVVNDDNEHNGRPLCEKVTLSTIPGFIKCQSGDIPLFAPSNEITAVADFLEAGFYYE